MQKNKHPFITRALCLLFSGILVLGTLAACSGGADAPAPQSEAETESYAPVPDDTSGDTAPTTPATGAQDYSAIPLPDDYRAMWIAYIELETVDFSSADAFRLNISAMFDNCATMGLNTVIVSVRPFGDALYPSSIFPWSHIATGTQGQDPGFDPLAIMVEEAHDRSLRFEAAINPYRARHNNEKPAEFSADCPAVLHPSWTYTVGESVWYDPGLPEVQQMVVDGVREIVENYDVDGIHFDDYFYAGTDPSVDAETWAEHGGGLPLEEWRRENVSGLVQAVYNIIRQANPSVIFGIAPQGNMENNYTQQYSDVETWLAVPGYVDYIMPQLYWGFNWTQNGADWAAFGNATRQWAAYDRADTVRLYAGLAAHRIGGFETSGDGDQSEWYTGRNLADMVLHLGDVAGFEGFMLFRYDFLYRNTDELGAQEADALARLLNGE